MFNPASIVYVFLQAPYNFERLMLLFSDMDYALVDSLIQEFEQKGSLKIPEDLHMKVSYYHDTFSSNPPCTHKNLFLHIFTTFASLIIHCTLCLPLKILPERCFQVLNFFFVQGLRKWGGGGGVTKCIMGNVKLIFSALNMLPTKLGQTRRIMLFRSPVCR